MSTLKSWLTALDERDFKTLRKLADKGPPPPYPDGTPLLHKVITRLEADALIACGADVNAVDGHGRTALHEAAYRLRLAVVSRLLEEGAYAGARCLKGRTPLHEAAGSPREEGKARKVVQRLIQAHAPMDTVDTKGRTPAHHAARKSRARVVLVLRESGARFDIADKDGVTAETMLKPKNIRTKSVRMMLAQERLQAAPKILLPVDPPIPAQQHDRPHPGRVARKP